jgi:hypothetical protein
VNTVKKGRLGEAAVAHEFVRQGYDVYLPVFGNANFDMVVVKEGILSRVEVKSTSYKGSKKSYAVQLKSVRHNTNETRVIKFDGNKSDLLAVYIVPENRVVILNSSDHHGKTVTHIEGTAQGANRS